MRIMKITPGLNLLVQCVTQLLPRGGRRSWRRGDEHLDPAGNKCLELVIGGDQHDLVRLAGALVACGEFPVGAGLHHLLCGLLGVLLVGRGEVVDGILHHVPRVDGLLQTAGDALHRGEVLCRRTQRFMVRQVMQTGETKCMKTRERQENRAPSSRYTEVVQVTSSNHLFCLTSRQPSWTAERRQSPCIVPTVHEVNHVLLLN